MNFGLPDVAESTIAAIKRGSVISEEGEWHHAHSPVDKEPSLGSGVYGCVCLVTHYWCYEIRCPFSCHTHAYSQIHQQETAMAHHPPW